MLIDIKDITLEKLNFNVEDLRSGDIIKMTMPDYTYDYETARQCFDVIKEQLPEGIELIFMMEKMDLKK